MLQQPIFLGYLISDALSNALQRVNPSLLQLFTQGGEEYLEFFHHQGQRYLGKSVGDHTDTARLRLVAPHILSLLQRLLPDYSFSIDSLLLLPGEVAMETPLRKK